MKFTVIVRYITGTVFVWHYIGRDTSESAWKVKPLDSIGNWTYFPNEFSHALCHNVTKLQIWVAIQQTENSRDHIIWCPIARMQHSWNLKTMKINEAILRGFPNSSVQWYCSVIRVISVLANTTSKAPLQFLPKDSIPESRVSSDSKTD